MYAPPLDQVSDAVMERIGNQEVRLRLLSVICTVCDSNIISLEHRVGCLAKAKTGFPFKRSVNELIHDASPLDYSKCLKQAILSLKIASGVKYNPDTGITVLEVGSTMKVLCVNCSTFVVTAGHSARCVNRGSALNTDLRVGATTRWTTERRQAWIGDAIHRIDIRLAAVIKGVSDVEKNGFETSYLDAGSQAKYMKDFYADSTPVYRLSNHSISTIFEARYHTEFRRAYLSRSFGTETATVIINSIDETYDSDTFSKLDTTRE